MKVKVEKTVREIVVPTKKPMRFGIDLNDEARHVMESCLYESLDTRDYPMSDAESLLGKLDHKLQLVTFIFKLYRSSTVSDFQS